MPEVLPIVEGQRFGRLTALYRKPDRPSWWMCRCSCKERRREFVRGDTLIGGERIDCTPCRLRRQRRARKGTPARSTRAAII